MSTFDVIVVGAGLNGLVAGAILARRGKSVLILEQREKTGGMATLCQEDGPALAHLLYNLSPKALAAIGLDAKGLSGEHVPTVSLGHDGAHTILRGGQVENADGTSHRDAKAAKALLDQLAAYGALLRHLAEAPPPGGGLRPDSATLLRLCKLGLGLRRIGKPQMRRFLQVLLSNAYDLILDEIPDGPLAGLLAADATRGTASGPRSPGTVFNLIYRMGHGGAASLPQGGMTAVISACADAARAAGCQIETGRRVTKIHFENDAVTGVTVEGGTGYSAAQVLVNAGPSATLSLIGPAPFDVETTTRIRNIRARGTAAKVNLRLDRMPRVPGLPEGFGPARWIVAPSAAYVEEAFNPAKYGEMSPHPVIEAVITQHQGTNWLSAIVQYAPFDLEGGWTTKARDRLLNITLDTLAQYVPDLSGTVTETQVITPDKIAAATGVAGGHWHHGEMALDQLLTLRPGPGMARHAIGPRGLYLCGAASHPGGDVMGLAGHNAALAALGPGA